MALSESARQGMPPGAWSQGRPAELAREPEEVLQACIDDIEEVQMARAEALAAELFPDEDEDEAPARPLSQPPAAVNTRPAHGRLPLAPPPRSPEGAGAPRAVDRESGPARGAAHAGTLGGNDADSVFGIAGVPEEDIQLLGLMESMKTADAVLQVVSEHLPRLTAETAAEALHLVARRLPSAQHGITQNPRLPPVLLKLSRGISELQSARSLSQLAWTLGKLGTRAHAHSPPLLPGMEECMLYVCGMPPEVMAQCSPQDLTNTLWGIARLFPGGASGTQGHVLQVSLVSHAIVRRCVRRVGVLTPQCVANSFWAMARLKVHGLDVEEYVRLALEQTSTPAQLESFTPQGLANVLWALAQLRAAGVGKGPQDNSVRLTLIAMAEAAAGRLPEFQAQELSMVAWSYAKLYEFKKGEMTGPSKKGRASSRPASVDEMLLKLSSLATDHIDKFEDQGISNIAWSLATLELTGAAPALAPARGFIEAAMAHCTTELGGYSAQAVSNLMWACVRMDCSRPDGRNRSSMGRFSSAVAEEMMLRMTTPSNGLRHDRDGGHITATWRDLAGVAVALSHWRQKSQSVMNFMTLLTHQAAECVAKGDLTSQQMLNIAQSAARLHVPPEDMQRLVDAIEACIVTRGLQLNDLDRRQWGEVQHWCPPHRTGSGYACNENMHYNAWDQYAAQQPWENQSSKWSPSEHSAAQWARGGDRSGWYASWPWGQGIRSAGAGCR